MYGKPLDSIGFVSAFDPEIGAMMNRELLRQCIEFFRKLDCDILVRDRSCLGFPTYQVAIPGYSEVHVNRLNHKMDDHRYAPHAIRALRAPAKATYPDLLGLVMHLDQMNTFTSNIRGVHGFLMSAKLSANLSPAREKFLMSSSLAYVYYALGQIPQVIPNINSMLSCATKKEEPALICMKRYFSLLGAGYSKEAAFRIVSFFHQDSEVQTLLNNLNQGKNH